MQEQPRGEVAGARCLGLLVYEHVRNLQQPPPGFRHFVLVTLVLPESMCGDAETRRNVHVVHVVVVWFYSCIATASIPEHRRMMHGPPAIGIAGGIPGHMRRAETSRVLG